MAYYINPGQDGDFLVCFFWTAVIAVQIYHRLDKTTLAHMCFGVSF